MTSVASDFVDFSGLGGEGAYRWVQRTTTGGIQTTTHSGSDTALNTSQFGSVKVKP